MFEQKGTFAVSAEGVDEDKLMEMALEAGADDVTREGDLFEVTCAPHDFHKVKTALAAAKIETISAQIGMSPKNTVAVENDKAKQVISLMETLEEHEDVQNVYANFDISEEALKAVSGD